MKLTTIISISIVFILLFHISFAIRPVPKNVQDADADGVPDEFDKCPDTSPTDLVDTDLSDGKTGCSIQQGAEKIGYFTNDGDYNLAPWKDFQDALKNIFNRCPGGYDFHCCNGIKDNSELGVDCGVGAGCKPCNIQCQPVQEGGKISVLFIPVGYSSNALNLFTGFSIWTNEVNTQISNLESYHPFSKDKFSFYRIDLFDMDKGTISKLDSNPSNKKTSDYLPFIDNLNKEYSSFCPSADVYAYVIPSIDPLKEGYSYPFKNFLILYSSSEKFAFAHEMGHGLCGLVDEYWGILTPSIGTNFPPSFYKNSFNCDNNPDICDTDSNGKIIQSTCRPINKGEECKPPNCICKWNPDSPQNKEYNQLFLQQGILPGTYSYPESQCIEGCGYYLKGIYRPSDSSLMYSKDKPFNAIGLDVCKKIIDKYNS